MNGLELIKHTVGGGVMTASGAPNGAVSLVKNGKIEFTDATEIHVDKCFSTAYDNYLIVVRHADSRSGPGYQSRLRETGAWDAESNYTSQALRVDNTSVTGERFVETAAQVSVTGTSTNGFHLYVYGPALKQPTAFRSVTVSTYNTAFIYDFANTHSVDSKPYDGITLYGNSSSTSGSLTIYGFTKGTTP